MGTLRQDFICACLYPYKKNEVKKLNQFVKKHKNLLIKKNGICNGEVNYIMIWDGSKEGWPDSNKADIIREKFIKLLEDADAFIYHVRDGDHYFKPFLVDWRNENDIEEYLK